MGERLEFFPDGSQAPARTLKEPAMIAELAALALTCAPNIHPVTLHALIRHESRVKQYAIGVNRKVQHLRQQPKTLAEATAAADRLIDQGIDFDAGLGRSEEHTSELQSLMRIS